MPIENCGFVNTIPIMPSMAEFFARNLSPNRKKICEILRTFSDDAESIYLAGIAVLQISDFPAKQSVVAHCFRELINAIVRCEESAIKQQAIDGLKAIEFIKNGEHSEEKLKQVVDGIWANHLKPLHNEQSKLMGIFLERNPKKLQEMLVATPEEKTKIEDGIKSIVNQVRGAKGRIDGLRHFNTVFQVLPEDQFNENISILENYILQLEIASYIEQKQALDGILESANTRAD